MTVVSLIEKYMKNISTWTKYPSLKRTQFKEFIFRMTMISLSELLCRPSFYVGGQVKA